MIACTFAGHRELRRAGMEGLVGIALERLLTMDDSFCFYAGGMGEFDRLCARTVCRKRQQHPGKHIELLLVEPYMHKGLNDRGRALLAIYDEIIIPMQLSTCHYKAAIRARNRWMVDHCRFLLAYVDRPYGGAYDTLRYARSRDTIVWNLAKRFWQRGS